VLGSALRSAEMRSGRRSRMEYGPLNRMTETTEALKSVVTPGRPHFCGAQPIVANADPCKFQLMAGRVA